MRRRRGPLGLALGVSFLFWALLVWALGWADDPLRFLVLSGAWTGIAAALLGWPKGMLAPLASLAVAAPALARQPLLVFASQALFLLGLALVGSGLGFALRKGSSRRQLHRQLERSYGEEVFENSLNILHVIDREGNVVRRNRRSLELLGWPHRRSLHVTEYVHPQHLDEFRLELERLFERGSCATCGCGSSRKASTASPWRCRPAGSPGGSRCWRRGTFRTYKSSSTSSTRCRPATAA